MNLFRSLPGAALTLFLVSVPAPGFAQTSGSGTFAEPCVALFVEASELIGPYTILSDRPAARADPAALNRAIGLLDRALQMCPEHWPAWWFKGKAHQATGDSGAAFQAFRRAYEIQPRHPDVVNETTIEAVNVGELDFALNATSRALSEFPDNLPLRARLALVLLLKGRLDEAIAAADRALALAPGDQISMRIRRLAIDVREGRLQQPRSFQDLLAAAQ